MNILHYSLGLYPNRTGGLNRYATDLMQEQSKEHNVSLLYPSGINWLKRRIYVSSSKTIAGFKCFRLVNSTPIPLLYGIRNPYNFYEKKISLKSFDKFYNDVKPHVIHLHTLMGLSEDVIQYFKNKGVKIVYTSHDYFGLCPKVNLINEKGKLCEGPSEDRCTRCNEHAPSVFFLRLRNSSFAFIFRDIKKWIKDIVNF